jgi:hypothetical protein
MEAMMPVQSSMHFYLNWAKERLDEMDATLAVLEAKTAEVRAEARVKADQLIAELRKKRDEFQSTLKKQAEGGEAVWERIKVQLETEWKTFEAELKKYLEAVGQEIGQQQAVFKAQLAAQMKAWREAADKAQAAAAEFAAEQRKEIEASVVRMKADAAAAEQKLQKLAGAGNQSWAALNGALAETRGVFDRANQSARDAFKKAAA